MKKIISLLSVVMLLCLVGCSSTVTQTEKNTQEENKVLSLVGNWKQVNSNEQKSYQKAVISEDCIEIYWVFEEDDTEALYWAGTYEAPTSNYKEYKWASVNDKEKTGTSLLASGDETKEFVYKDGVISYSASAFGVTQTIKLGKE